MAPATARYKRLPGTKRGLFHGASLWLAEDHLLAVNNWRFSETYKRYYYRDIHALIVTKKPRWVVPVPWLILMCVAGFAALIFAVARAGLALEITSYGTLLLVLWLVVTALTRSCVCRIQTAVSCDALPSLYRLRAANKALAILEKVLEGVQGALPENWMEQLGEAPAPAPGTRVNVPPLPAVLQRRSRAWMLLEAVLYVTLIISALLVRLGGPPLDAFRLGLVAFEIILAVAVIAVQRATIRSAFWLALLAALFVGGTSYLDSIVAAIKDASAKRTRTYVSRSTGFREYPVLRDIVAGGYFGLGATGLILLARRAARKE